jgi:DNA-binding transcriptional regulator YdaS (Cro superfamily)
MDQSEVIRDALEKAGGTKAVATALGISAEGVRLWRSRGKVPADRVVELEQLTGVPREKLRPDLYAREQAA